MSPVRLRRLTDRLREERGIALVMAVGILAVLGIALTSLIYFTGSNSRSSNYAKGEQLALTLAEAGINNALGLISNPENDADLDDPALGAARTYAYAGGTVTWSGELSDTSPLHWTITSTGTVANPTGPGAADIRRTMTIRVPLRPPPEFREALEIWNWIYVHRVGSTCDMTVDQSVEMQSPLYVRGNLCLRNGASVWNGPLVVGGQLNMDQPKSSVGSQARPLGAARIGNGCKYRQINPLYNPCVANIAQTNIWATDFETEWDDYQISLPPVYWAAGTPEWVEVGWYEKASPGPYYRCTTTVGTPPVFDTMTTVGTRTVPDGFNNSVPGVVNLTPTGRSYTCITRRGQLSWDHVQRTLTVRGTIFIDGSAEIHNNSGVIRYVQQPGTDSIGSVIYLGGSLLIKNSIVCGKVNAQGNDCDYAGWDPNANLLVFSTYSKPTSTCSACGIEIVSSKWQGALYSVWRIQASTTSITQGPMVSEDEVSVGQTNGVDFPDVTITPIGMPGFGPEFYTALDPEYGD